MPNYRDETNVGKELRNLVTYCSEKEHLLITCACIRYRGLYLTLKPGYTQREFHNFLSELDTIDIADNTPYQEIAGVIWMSDGSWLQREWYDDEENWFHYQCPKYPDSWSDETAMNKSIGWKLETVRYSWPEDLHGVHTEPSPNESLRIRKKGTLIEKIAYAIKNLFTKFRRIK